MQIERARVMGRCMGVRRAEELALAAAAEAARTGKRVFTLGPLIHNAQAVAALKAAGVGVLEPDTLPSLPAGALSGAVIVIRAHGVAPESFRQLEALGAEVVNATCPRVLASQRRARKYFEDGKLVVIAGDAHHGEVTGILGNAPGALVAGSSGEAAAVAASVAAGTAVALIAQTTIRREEYEAIKSAFAGTDFEHFDSICPATSERQEAVAELVLRVDAVIVVGGKDSANTVRLFRSAQASGKPAWHVETAEELPDEVLGFSRVGLTAGASTPDSLVDEVEKTLLSRSAP